MADEPKKYVAKPKTEGEFKGETISFPQEYRGHTFSADEITQLLNGDVITIETTNKDGQAQSMTGQLGSHFFKGRKYWGFQFPYNEGTNAHGDTVIFPKQWCGHVFDDDEIQALLAGEPIEFSATSKRTGRDFQAKGQLEADDTENDDNNHWHFVPDFSN